MAEEKDYSFCVMPKQKMVHIAGPFDVKTSTPCYEIESNGPPYDNHKLEITRVLAGTPDNRQVGWQINNKSDYPVFITIKKDGQRI